MIVSAEKKKKQNCLFFLSSFAYTLVYHLCMNLEHSVVFFFW